MKKSVLIVIAILVVIVIGAHYADKATRLPHTSLSVSAAKRDAPDSVKPAPELTLKDLDGKDVSSHAVQRQGRAGQLLGDLVRAVQSGDSGLIELQQKYGPKGFTVLGVAMDDEGQSVVAPFVGKERFDVNGGQSQMNYPIVIGNDAAADKFGGLIGYPTSVLIDRDGKQVKSITGLINYDDISKAIESHL